MRGPQSGLPFRLAGILLCGTLAGCGVSGSTNVAPLPSFTPRPTVIAASPAGSDGVQHVTIAAKQSLFRPPNITAHPGTIRITVVNEDTVFHDIHVDVVGGATSGTIDGGATKSVQFNVHNLGRYGFFCSYHEDTGMIGVLDIK